MQVVSEHGSIVEEEALDWGDLYKLPTEQEWRKHFPIHSAQAEILNSPARFLLALGGKNSGKSVCGGCWLLRRLEENPQGQFLVVAPSFNIVSSATLEVFKKTVRGTPFDGTHHAGNSPWFECKSGARVYFRSAVDPDSFEGLKPVAAWIDEGGNISAEAWRAVKGRLVGTAGKCIITTTPYPKHDWLVTDFIEKARDGNKDYFFLCMPTTLNPKQDQHALEEEKSTLSDWEYQVKYEGKFTKPAGLVYKDFDLCIRTIKDLPPAVSYYAGVDWGGTDATVCLVGSLDDEQNLWVFHEHYVKNQKQNILEIIDDLKTFNSKLHHATGKPVAKYWCDHRPENVRALKRKGLNARPASKGANSIKLGISLVTARINRAIQGKPKAVYIIKETCPETCKEAGLYRYQTDEDGDLFGDVPQDKHNHGLDALRYLILGLDRKSRQGA